MNNTIDNKDNKDEKKEKEKIRVGFAVTGSFCTFSKVFGLLPALAAKYDIYPIVSFNTAKLDTRFFSASEAVKTLTDITGREPIDSIVKAEPIGPKGLFDVLVIEPCTGNTIGKIASGISDTPVTMAFKSHMRNGRPAVIGVSTNDGLSGSAENIGRLMNRKNVFFVPFTQDAPYQKERSLVADFSLTDKAIEAALEGKQLQPVLV